MEYNLGESVFAITTADIGHVPRAKGALVAFEVTDHDAFVKTLKQKSMSFVVDSSSTPVCRMAVIEDPDGNPITIPERHEH